MSAYSFFLAGTMQGSRPGAAEIDQGYRATLRDAILEAHPDARVYDPRELMAEWLLERADELRDAHASLAATPNVDRASHAPGVRTLTQMFWGLCGVAGDVNVVVAYLPDYEASMGTAVEMHSAYRNGRPVIAVTEMRQNLAVLSLASAITPDVEGLRALLASGWVDRQGVTPVVPDTDRHRPPAAAPPPSISVEELAQILREQQPGKIGPGVALDAATAFDDLGITSLDLVEVVFALEDRLGVEVVPADTAAPATLGELADMVNHVAAAAGAR